MDLLFTSTALRARTFENVLSGLDDAAAAFAEGVGRSPDDPAVRAFVGAVIGALMPVLLMWAAGGYTEDITELMDRTMKGLQEILNWR